MAHDVLFAIYVITVGFTAASLTGTLAAAVLGRSIDFRLGYDTPRAALGSVLLCLLAGPYLLFAAAIGAYRNNGMSRGMLAAGIVLSALWSLCAGIVVLQGAHVLTGGII